MGKILVGINVTCYALLVVVFSLVARTRSYKEGEVSDMHYYQDPYDKTKVTTQYPWVVSFTDVEDSISCTANVIMAHVSLTGCDCLAFPDFNSTTGEIFVRSPGDRYTIVGGIVHRKFAREVEELKTMKFIVHESSKYLENYNIWFFNYGLIVHEPFRRTPAVSAPMPVWSAKPDRMELRYQQVIATGAPCYLIGWQQRQWSQIKITVKIAHEPLAMVKTDANLSEDCIRATCLMSDVETSKCSRAAVSCTSNGSSTPYSVESGMPLVCGTSGEVYGISTSSGIFDTNDTDYNGEIYTPLWKLAPVMDWLRQTAARELKARIQAPKNENNRYVETRQKHDNPN